MAEHRRSKPARLLVLGAGAAQLGLLEAAAAREGLTVIAADRDPLAPGFALADERALISSEDEQAIERLARARSVDGIVSPGADWPVGIAARVAERLGLAHPVGAVTATLATTKTRQREALAAAGVLQPRVFSPGDPAVPFPCVVKAADRQGQRGLTLVRDPSSYDAAVAAAASEARNGGVLVEELIDGPEVTVNAVSLEGRFVPLTVTDRVLAEPPAFGVALAHVWPSAHERGEVVAAAAAAVAALGITNGPSYTQIRLGAGERPHVMEVAARVGGGHDAELCRAVTGVDLNDLAISFALGEPVDSPVPRRGDTCVALADRGTTEGETGPAPTGAGEGEAGLARTGAPGAPKGPSFALGEPWAASGGKSQARPAGPGGGCVVFLVAPEGELVATEGVEEALAVEGVEWVRLYRRPGWTFVPLRRGADRAGAVLASGASREEALVRARRAAQAVRFLVDADAS